MGRVITNQRTWNMVHGAWNGSNPLPWRADAVYFASGREALVALIRAIGMRAGDAVLLPAFVPEGVIAPFRATGCDVRFYDLDENLDPDFMAVERILKEHRPGLAVFIHYFGIAKDIHRFVEMCHRWGTRVIEDMAQALKLPGARLGTTGDFTLHSLTKVLPIPDGAVLENNDLYSEVREFRFHHRLENAAYCGLRTAELTLNTLPQWLKSDWSKKLWSWVSPFLYRALPSYRTLMAYYSRPHRMSRFSRWCLHRMSVPAVVRHRMQLELLYERGLSRELFPRFAAPDATREHCMMGFPVHVSDRASLTGWLKRHDIQGVFFQSKWDFAPKTLEFAGSRDAMGHHFLFPTAASLSESDVLRVIEVANAWVPTQAALPGAEPIRTRVRLESPR